MKPAELISEATSLANDIEGADSLGAIGPPYRNWQARTMTVYAALVVMRKMEAHMGGDLDGIDDLMGGFNPEAELNEHMDRESYVIWMRAIAAFVDYEFFGGRAE